MASEEDSLRAIGKSGYQEVGKSRGKGGKMTIYGHLLQAMSQNPFVNPYFHVILAGSRPGMP